MQEQAKSKVSGLAVVGLICTIWALVNITGSAFYFGVALTVIGFILGVIARKEIKHSNGKIRGKGIATAAVIIAIVGAVAIASRVSIILSLSGTRKGTAKTAATSVNLVGIKSALEIYKMDTGSYPKELSTLMIDSNGKGPYLMKPPKDAWGRDYVYRLESGGEGYELFSLGPDSIEGPKDDVKLSE